MPLTPKVFLTDLTLPTSDSTATVSEGTVSFSDIVDLDRIGSMGLTVLLGTNGANRILTARPPRGNLPPIVSRLGVRPILAEFSFSGSRSEIDHRAMIIKTTTTANANSGPSIGFDNDDLALGLSTAQVDRMTLVQVNFMDLLNADPGGIRVYSDNSHDTGLLPEGTAVPFIKGVLKTTIGNTNWPQRELLDWIGVPSEAVKNLPVSVSYNGDPLVKVMELAAKRLAGLNLGAGDQPGTLGHIVYDTSSVDLNIGTGINSDIIVDKPAVVIGYYSDIPFMDFIQNADPTDFVNSAPVGDAMVTTTDLTTMTGQLELVGGRASQGLPVGSVINSIVIVNFNLSAPVSGGSLPGTITGGGPPTPGLIPGAVSGQLPSESALASLPIIGLSTSPLTGGAYYYPGDGAYYPLGQCPGINELVYDEENDDLYAATGYGVRTHKGTVLDDQPWTKVGGLRYPVSRLWVHRVKVNGASKFWLFAQVDAGQAGVDGIWSTPPIGATEDEDAPGWARVLNQPKITAFTPIPGWNYCVFSIGDRAWMVNSYGPIGEDTVAPEVGTSPIEMPFFETVSRLDPGPPGHYFILTGAGSRGLYMNTPPAAKAITVGGTFPTSGNLVNGATYHYTITYVDAGGVESSPAQDVVVTIPSGGTGTSGAVGFTWERTIGAVRYNLYRGNPGGPAGVYTTLVASVDASTHSWADVDAGSARTPSTASASLVNLNPGVGVGNIRDIDNQPINVNRLIPYSEYGGLINGTRVSTIACTNRGLWFTPTLNGTGWKPMNGQSGLAGSDVSMMAVGGIRRIIDRDGQALYAVVGQGSDVVTSFSGGLWWEPTVSRSLELGTVFSKYAEPPSLPGDPPAYPDWDVTAIGTGRNPAPGRVVTPDPALVPALQMPPNYQLARRDTYTNTITYRLVNTESTAPYFGIESMTLSDIYSGVDVDQAVAEEALLGIGLEYLYNASLPQTIIQFDSWFSEPSAKLRKLRPGHMITLTYSGTVLRKDPDTGDVIGSEYAQYLGEKFFVLTVGRQMDDGSSTCDVKVTVGRYLLKTPITGDELAANVLYGFKNDRRFL